MNAIISFAVWRDDGRIINYFFNLNYLRPCVCKKSFKLHSVNRTITIKIVKCSRKQSDAVEMGRALQELKCCRGKIIEKSKNQR